MARLLYIETSPRKERSASIEVAKTFIGEVDDPVNSGEMKTSFQ